MTFSKESHGEKLAKMFRKEARAANGEGVTVQLEWVKAHAGILGNEKADALAKRATSQRNPHATTFTSSAYCNRRCREARSQEVERAWRLHSRKGANYAGNPKRVRQFLLPDDQRPTQVLLSRLRTGHVRVGHYLHRIGKRPTKECQCGAPDQTVQHVLLNCPLTHDTRREARSSLHTKNPTMLTLLYEEEGIAAAVKIWGEFEKARSAYEVVRDEDREEEETDNERGHGELAEVEGSRRQLNGEYELAIRGYGE